jgi:hypothetical protein
MEGAIILGILTLIGAIGWWGYQSLMVGRPNQIQQAQPAPATPAPGGAAVPPPSNWDKVVCKVEKYNAWIFFVVLFAVLWYVDSWLVRMVIVGVVYIAGHIPKDEDFCHKIQHLAIGAGALCLIAIPLTMWVTSYSAQDPPTCDPFSSEEVHECLWTEKPTVLTFGQLTAENEFQACVVTPEGETYESEPIGPNVFSVRSTSGPFVARYKLLKVTTCPAQI